MGRWVAGLRVAGLRVVGRWVAGLWGIGWDLKTPTSDKTALGAWALFSNFEVGVRGPSPQPIYEKLLFLNPAPVPRRALKNEIAPLRSGL